MSWMPGKYYAPEGMLLNHLQFLLFIVRVFRPNWNVFKDLVVEILCFGNSSRGWILWLQWSSILMVIHFEVRRGLKTISCLETIKCVLDFYFMYFSVILRNTTTLLTKSIKRIILSSFCHLATIVSKSVEIEEGWFFLNRNSFERKGKIR